MFQCNNILYTAIEIRCCIFFNQIIIFETEVISSDLVSDDAFINMTNFLFQYNEIDPMQKQQCLQWFNTANCNCDV